MPEGHPFACSRCGCYIGTAARLRGDDYCDDCKRNDQVYVSCEKCGDRLPQERATAVNVTAEDEYYPEFIHFCPTHAPESGAGAEAGGEA